MILNPVVIRKKEQETPVIDVSSSGLITATAGDKSVTEQLPTIGPMTLTPKTGPIEIVAGRYLAGSVMIQGDSNLLPANIKSGVSIFGVSGIAQTSAQARGCVNIVAERVMSIEGVNALPTAAILWRAETIGYSISALAIDIAWGKYFGFYTFNTETSMMPTGDVQYGVPSGGVGYAYDATNKILTIYLGNNMYALHGTYYYAIG